MSNRTFGHRNMRRKLLDLRVAMANIMNMFGQGTEIIANRAIILNTRAIRWSRRRATATKP